jgi:hypothetical protein
MAGKFPWGGGDGSDHSSEFAFQGLGGAFFPARNDHRKLNMKMSCAVPRMSADTEMNVFIG